MTEARGRLDEDEEDEEELDAGGHGGAYHLSGWENGLSFLYAYFPPWKRCSQGRSEQLGFSVKRRSFRA